MLSEAKHLGCPDPAHRCAEILRFAHDDSKVRSQGCAA